MQWFWGSGSLSNRLAWTCFAILAVAHIVVAHFGISLR
jgi:hypothetical protein